MRCWADLKWRAAWNSLKKENKVARTTTETCSRLPVTTQEWATSVANSVHIFSLLLTYARSSFFSLVFMVDVEHVLVCFREVNRRSYPYNTTRRLLLFWGHFLEQLVMGFVSCFLLLLLFFFFVVVVVVVVVAKFIFWISNFIAYDILRNIQMKMYKSFLCWFCFWKIFIFRNYLAEGTLRPFQAPVVQLPCQIVNG